MKKKIYQSAAYLVMFSLMPLANFAQEQQAEPSNTSYFSNALFNTLLVSIILLMILVLVLTNVLKNLTHSDYFINKFIKPKNDGNHSGKTLGAVIGLSLLSLAANAQDATASKAANDLIGGMDQFTFYFMITIIILELVLVAVLINLIRGLLKNDISPETEAALAKKPKQQSVIMQKLTDAVEIEREADIMLDHDYDGIKELDNNLPPWWKYGFYFTILVGVIYLTHYHILKTGDLQATEYDKEIAKAKSDVEEYMKTAANNVDENTVKMLDNSADLAAGKSAFDANCKACHGGAGEGGVGPNLTDDYWLHGGSISDVFKTVKYGWPDKGMKSWKEDLSPMQIAQVTSYIKSLRGTNPANGKAPQGDLYSEAGAAPLDSTAISTDSLKVTLPTDSLKPKESK